MVKINIHAGHNPSKSIACGAVGFLNESDEARKVVKRLIYLFKRYNIQVFDCTCNNGTSQSDVLNKIKKKELLNTVDYNISVHFNSGRNDKKGDKNVGGSEIWVNNKSNQNIRTLSNNILNELYNVNGNKNRGLKATESLYILNALPRNSLLIECCFVDDLDDFKVYNYKRFANAIFIGIIKSLIMEKGTNFRKKYNIENENDFFIYLKNGKFIIDFVHYKKSLKLLKIKGELFN